MRGRIMNRQHFRYFPPTDDDGGDWDPRLSDAARGYNEPPETPRDRMWDKIAALRAEAAEDGRGEGAGSGRTGRRASHRPWWQRRSRLWPVIAAAALVAGVLIGRNLPEGETGGRNPRDVADARDDSATGGPRQGTQDESGDPATGTWSPALADVKRVAVSGPDPAFYRRAALPVLGRTETLLLQVRTTDETEHAAHYSERASRLLVETRLLLTSPAADEADLRSLLEDLELALARVVHLSAEQGATERRNLNNGLARKAILARLRNELAADQSPSGL